MVALTRDGTSHPPLQKCMFVVENLQRASIKSAHSRSNSIAHFISCEDSGGRDKIKFSTGLASRTCALQTDRLGILGFIEEYPAFFTNPTYLVAQPLVTQAIPGVTAWTNHAYNLTTIGFPSKADGPLSSSICISSIIFCRSFLRLF